MTDPQEIARKLPVSHREALRRTKNDWCSHLPNASLSRARTAMRQHRSGPLVERQGAYWRRTPLGRAVAAELERMGGEDG